MIISEKGANAIRAREGLRLKAYKDTGGVVTIGYGDTHDVHEGMEITQDEAEKRLFLRLEPIEVLLNHQTSWNLQQNEFDALCSFVYNIGLAAFAKSTMKRMLDEGAPRPEVIKQFSRWIYDNGHVDLVLVRRRGAEAAQFRGENL